MIKHVNNNTILLEQLQVFMGLEFLKLKTILVDTLLIYNISLNDTAFMYN